MLELRAGVRNAYRNPVRAALAVLVLGLSVGLFMTMLWGSATTAREAEKLKARAATRIAVNVAGNTSGYVGTSKAGELPADVSDLVGLPQVVKVESYVKRQFVNNRRRDAPSGVLIGVQPGATLRLQSMGAFTGGPALIAGREFGAQDRGEAVAIVGEVFARSRGLEVGDDFVLPAEELQRGQWRYVNAIKEFRAKVVGIYRIGVIYGDNQVFAPVDTVQNVLGIGQDRVSQYIVTVDSAENVPAAAQALRRLLGPGVDVIGSDASAVQAARILESATLSGRIGAAVAAVAGALVVLFTMLIVTRERTREIGVLKAIGASTLNVAALYTGETFTLAVLGGGLGVVIYLLGGPVLAGVVVGSADLTRQALGEGLPIQQIGWGLALALGFGLAGSLFAVWRAVRLRPSEAMRQV